jgi:hypothetical protein
MVARRHARPVGHRHLSTSGTPRVAKGVFSGVGRVVEIENLPGDPDNVSRDDLVFAEGSIHIVSTIVDLSFSVNPHSCLVRATAQATGEITGGTGLFAAASGSYTSTVIGSAVFPRNPDGSCSLEQIAPRGGQVRGERDAVVLTVWPRPGHAFARARRGGTAALLGPGWGEGQPLELDGTQVRVVPEVGRQAAGLLELAAAACADRRRSLVARLLGRR